MSCQESVEAGSAPLTLEEVFEFASFTQGHGQAGPFERPWAPVAGPDRDAGVMLVDPAGEVLGDANVSAACGVPKEVNLIFVAGHAPATPYPELELHGGVPQFRGTFRGASQPTGLKKDRPRRVFRAEAVGCGDSGRQAGWHGCREGCRWSWRPGLQRIPGRAPRVVGITRKGGVIPMQGVAFAGLAPTLQALASRRSITR